MVKATHQLNIALQPPQSDAAERKPLGAPPKHEPSAEEIREECERIRASWSTIETHRRGAWMKSQPVEVQTFDDRWFETRTAQIEP